MKKIVNKRPKNVLKDKLFMTLLVLVVVFGIGMIILKMVNKNNLDASSELVTTLHTYFNYKDVENCDGLFTYSGDVVTYDSMDDDLRLCLAYQRANIKEKDIETKTATAKEKSELCKVDDMTFRTDKKSDKCTYSIIEQSIIDNAYKELYGKDVVNNETFKPDGYSICYLKDGKYYCGLSEVYTYTIGSESLIYRTISKAVEKGSNIVIYDYFVKITDETCYKAYNTKTINENCTDEYKNVKEMDYKFMKKYGTQYKHTYKKAKDGTYYWVSSQPAD